MKVLKNIWRWFWPREAFTLLWILGLFCYFALTFEYHVLWAIGVGLLLGLAKIQLEMEANYKGFCEGTKRLSEAVMKELDKRE